MSDTPIMDALYGEMPPRQPKSEPPVRSSELLGHARPTTEEVNAQWEAFQKARRECPALDRYYKRWNKRANLYQQIELLTEELKRIAECVPDEHKHHLP